MTTAQQATLETAAVLAADTQRGAFWQRFMQPGIFDRKFEHSRCKREYDHLLQLPDYLLKDLGLTRAQIVEARRRHLL